MNRKLQLPEILLLLLLLTIPAFGQIKGAYVNSYDGDQVKAVVVKGDKPITRAYRLLGVDAPEMRGHQPGAVESRDALRSSLAGKTVVITVRGRDTRWRRPLALVSVDGVDVGLEQVRAGHAWFYRQYARSLKPEERVAYAAAEAEARAGKRGVWANEGAIPPWAWRKGKR